MLGGVGAARGCEVGKDVSIYGKAAEDDVKAG
jgi:hypothetical protein